MYAKNNKHNSTCNHHYLLHNLADLTKKKFILENNYYINIVTFDILVAITKNEPCLQNFL